MNVSALPLTKNQRHLYAVLAVTSGAGTLGAALVLGAKLTLILTAGALGMLGFVMVTLRRELYGLWLMLALFYFIPFESLSQSVRMGRTAWYSLYSRFSLYFAPWDYLIFLVAALWLYKNASKKRFVIRWLEFPEMKLYALLMAGAFAMGLLHVSGSVFSAGPTWFLRPVIAVMPFYYFVVMYLFTINFIASREDAARTVRFFWLLNILFLFYAVYRIIGIAAGYIETLRGFGVPIVIHEQISLILFPVLLYFAFFLLKVRHRYRSFLVAFIFGLLIIAGTRRFNYITFALGMAFTVFYAVMSGRLKTPRFLWIGMRIILFAVILCVVVYLLFPALAQGISNSVRSLYFISEFGLSYGGAMRKAEFENLILNLDASPWHYLFGFGLGTLWKERVYAPQDPRDTNALIRSERPETRGWYMSYHLPYISTLFRLGYAGTVILLTAYVLFIRRSVMFVRRAKSSPVYQAIVVALAAYLSVFMFLIGESPNPTNLIFCGFLYGLLTSINRHCLTTQSAPRETAQAVGDERF